MESILMLFGAGIFVQPIVTIYTNQEYIDNPVSRMANSMLVKRPKVAAQYFAIGGLLFGIGVLITQL